jgi:hypothetical protein
MNLEDKKKAFWAIVGFTEHQQIAGFLDEYCIGGCDFLRITIPETTRQPSWSRLLKDNLIHSIDPCTEEIARRKAELLDIAPTAIGGVNPTPDKMRKKNSGVTVMEDTTPVRLILHSAVSDLSFIQNRIFLDEDDNGV